MKKSLWKQNEEVARKLDAMDLPEDVQGQIDATDFNIIAELFGYTDDREEIIRFVREELLSEDL